MVSVSILFMRCVFLSSAMWPWFCWFLCCFFFLRMWSDSLVLRAIQIFFEIWSGFFFWKKTRVKGMCSVFVLVVCFVFKVY